MATLCVRERLNGRSQSLPQTNPNPAYSTTRMRSWHWHPSLAGRALDPHGRSSLSTARKTIFVYGPTWVYDGVALYWQNQPVMGGQVQRGTSQEAQVSAPWVTVAVPSYNQGRFLDATLRSIFAQSV